MTIKVYKTRALLKKQGGRLTSALVRVVDNQIMRSEMSSQSSAGFFTEIPPIRHASA